jgi:hypothetical protein
VLNKHLVHFGGPRRKAKRHQHKIDDTARHGCAVIAGTELARLNPAFASEVQKTFARGRAKATSSRYATATDGLHGYRTIMRAYAPGGDPAWPARAVDLAFWLVYIADHVKVETAQQYLGAVKMQHFNEGLQWPDKPFELALINRVIDDSMTSTAKA